VIQQLFAIGLAMRTTQRLASDQPAVAARIADYMNGLQRVIQQIGSTVLDREPLPAPQLPRRTRDPLKTAPDPTGAETSAPGPHRPENRDPGGQETSGPAGDLGADPPTGRVSELKPALHLFRGAAVQLVGAPFDVGEHIDDPGQVLEILAAAVPGRGRVRSVVSAAGARVRTGGFSCAVTTAVRSVTAYTVSVRHLRAVAFADLAGHLDGLRGVREQGPYVR